MNKKIWDETLTRATTGMNLEDMMLSEISQTQKYKYYMILGVPGGPVVKNLPANPGNEGSIPGSRRSPGSRNGNPLQYSCMENSKDRGAWLATVHGVTKKLNTTEQLNKNKII